jgi:hypothetical protein
MVDQKSNVVPIMAAAHEQSRRAGKSPLAEGHIRGNGESVWVHVDNTEMMKSVYAGLAKELRKRFSVDDDSLQSDPHKGFKIVDFFGVWMRPPEQREPEELGTVSLFVDAKNRMVMKMNPAMPGAANILIEALGPALGSCIEKLGTSNIAIIVREGSDFEF